MLDLWCAKGLIDIEGMGKKVCISRMHPQISSVHED